MTKVAVEQPVTLEWWWVRGCDSVLRRRQQHWDESGNRERIRPADCAVLPTVLKKYGGHSHGQLDNLASAPDIATILSDESARTSMFGLRHFSEQRLIGLDEEGRFVLRDKQTSLDASRDAVAEILWSQLRLGRGIIRRKDAALYPTKVSLLLEGMVVAPDRHVAAALKQLGLDGLYKSRFSLQPQEWESPAPPVSVVFRKLLALVYIAADLWAEDPRYRETVERWLPALSGRTGRVLDILLLTADKAGVNPRMCFRFVPKFGAWHDGLRCF